mmetsp:Transcript_20409/g.17726  ORF Transcript_20409/g.17726 Transcript_20409/m.17726 type:complete len:228 (+) Transcript_20409:4336-5019(+)
MRKSLNVSTDILRSNLLIERLMPRNMFLLPLRSSLARLTITLLMLKTKKMIKIIRRRSPRSPNRAELELDTELMKLMKKRRNTTVMKMSAPATLKKTLMTVIMKRSQLKPRRVMKTLSRRTLKSKIPTRLKRRRLLMMSLKKREEILADSLRVVSIMRARITTSATCLSLRSRAMPTTPDLRKSLLTTLLMPLKSPLKSLVAENPLLPNLRSPRITSLKCLSARLAL